MEEKLNKQLISSKEKDFISNDEKTRKIVEKYGSKEQDPITSANCISRFFLYWAYKIIKLGNLLPLKVEYFGKLKGKYSCVTYLKNIKNIWETKGYKLKKNIPLIQTGILANIKYIIIVFFLSLIKTLTNLVSIDLFREYMKRFEMTQQEIENGKSYYRFFYHTQIGIICLGIKLFEVFFDRRYNEYKAFITFKSTAEFQCLLYDKLIKVSPSSFKERAEDEEFKNLMNIDAHKLTLLMKSCPDALTIPINIITYSYMLFKFFGFSFIFGIITLFLFMIINILFSNKSIEFYLRQLYLKDKRMRIITETFNNIKNLKLYGWENKIKRKIKETRENELNNLLQKFNGENINSTIQWFAPIATTIVTIGVYRQYHDKLKLEDIMSSLKIFNSIQEPIRLIPDLIQDLNEVDYSMKRIEKYLCQEEINPGNVLKKDKYMTDNNLSIKIVNGNYSWGIPPISLDNIKKEDLNYNNLENLIMRKKSQKNFNKSSIELNVDLGQKGHIQSEKLNQRSFIKNDSKQNNEIDNKLDDSVLDILEEIKKEKYQNKLIKPVLKNINCEIKKGEFICVIGEVGSGKSSFINAILNNLLPLQGSTKLYVNGSISYVSQKSWFKNGTIRDNIIFYQSYDKEKYKNIIDLAQLNRDFEIFDEGDLTEIGEKGVNLSGGQKARISIARALYSERDIYIFDNPICSLDSNVGMEIMKNCIIKHLSNKTRILVTHALQYIPFADRIFYINNGEIKWIGTYEEIKQQYFFSSFYEKKKSEHILERKNSQKIRDDFLRKISFKNMNYIKEFKKKKKKKEEKGELQLSIYKDFFLKIVGISTLFIIIILMIIMDLSRSAQDLWLGYWIKHQEKSKNFFYFIIFSLFGVVGCVFTFFHLKVQTNRNIHISRTLYNNMVESLIRAPIPTFHDIIPKGTILNRFNSDITSVDNGEMNNIVNILSKAISLITCIGICGYYEPYSLLTIPPILLIGFKVSKFYIITSRKLRKIKSSGKTPILNLYSETIPGIAIIRAFDLQQKYLSLFLETVDEHLKYRIINNGCTQWYDMILDLISFFFVAVLITFTILFKNHFSVLAVAFIYNYCDKMKSSLISGFHALISFEKSMREYENCVECTKCPSEAPIKKNIDKSLSNWPDKGKIEFINYSTKYRSDTGIVLHNLNFSIQGKEKIGIVGRTGSGKSTITLCLFRILEPAEGKILIDNIDISTIGLDKLRDSIAYIPQEPDLMEGTLRDNIDPFKLSTDEDIMNVMKKIELDYIVNRNNKRLMQEIKEGGNKLTIGEKQLICITRAILKKNKIIVMEEATASIDYETEKILQRAINELLNDCTIITISHRIKTVLNYDKILIIDKGKVVSSDSPKKLLNDKKSLFYQLYTRSNL